MKRSNFLKALGLFPFIPLSSFAKVENGERRIWKPEDITAGLYIVRCSATKGSTNHGFLASVMFQVGWSMVLGRHECTDITLTDTDGKISKRFLVVDRSSDSKHQYTLNSVSDGLSHADIYKLNPFMGYSKDKLCEYFNTDNHGYRPAIQEEVINAIKNCRKNFLNNV